MLTVLIPVYDDAEYIYACLNSLELQSFKKFTVIIIENGSSKLDSSISDNYKYQIKYIRRDEKSLSEALNFGLKMVTTEYIARMDADDISSPNRFREQINYLLNNPSIDLCGTHAEYFGKNKRKIKVLVPEDSATINYYLDRGYNAIIHGTIMFRSKLLKENFFYYDKKYDGCEDIELFIRLKKNHIKYGNLREVLYLIRIHQNSVISLNNGNNFSLKWSLIKSIPTKGFAKLFYSMKKESYKYYRKGLIYYLNSWLIISIYFFLIAAILDLSLSLKKLSNSILKK
jgi:glycosyltransferase involved in cell wall biosynthesis